MDKNRKPERRCNNHGDLFPVRNWITNSHWHYIPPDCIGNVGWEGLTVNSYFLGIYGKWSHGPGVGAVTTGQYCPAVDGDWEGSPDRFLRLTWTAAPTQGDPSYYPTFRNTVLEHYVQTARALAGKAVTLSWQLRSPGGAQVGLILWRAIVGQTMQRWLGPTINLPGDNLVHRYDFSMTLPRLPSGAVVTNDGNSYLAVGVDLIGASGPIIDFGPCQLNEGGPAPIDEVPRNEQKAIAMQQFP